MKMENERLCIEISEHGAEVTRIYDKKKETELLWEGNPTYWKRHSPILFPNVGKTYKNKVKINGISYPTSGHGFARDNDFKCICTKPDKAAFLFSSGEETKEVYPQARQQIRRHALPFPSFPNLQDARRTHLSCCQT